MNNFINLTWKTKPALFPVYRSPVICNGRTQQKHLFSCCLKRNKTPQHLWCERKAAPPCHTFKS